MFTKKHTPKPSDPFAQSQLALQKRMKLPQRHRLLQGYPMAPLMQPMPHPNPAKLPITPDPTRSLLIGVLPHPFCNPKVKGCGFCTFPHETYRRPDAEQVVDAVIHEIQTFHQHHPELCQHRVEGLYFGGGTANLTPPDSFAKLTDTLSQTFDLRDAEISLEGVPIYFLTRQNAMLDLLCRMPARHRRISMGVQTFDPTMLAKMGREAFSKHADLERLNQEAHARNLTTSADLLYNLPGQTLDQMRHDLNTAANLGFDQICVYHLVLFEGLGTPWSTNRTMLDALPDQQRALENSLAVREHLHSLGYIPSTLTNFERADVHNSARRFIYESASFQPETYDGLGFGPSGLSCLSNPHDHTAAKTMNATTAADYVAQVHATGTGKNRIFRYTTSDLKLLHLTRQLPLMRLRRDTYRFFFNTDISSDFNPELTAFQEAGLLTLKPDAAHLTPKGMFFADSIAGLLAEKRVKALRSATDYDNDAAPMHMG